MPADAVARLTANVSEAAGRTVELERPKDAAHGDYATNVALQTAKALGRNPREVAEELAGRVRELSEVVSADVAGPGFLNLTVTDAFLEEVLGEMGEGYGGGWASAPERIQVELVSANPTGPITVASARNGALGDSIARLLAFGGHEVEREYYWNDAGAQMDRFRASVDAVRRGEDPPEDGYHGDYIRDLAAVPGDPVPAMLDQIVATLDRFRVPFDSFMREVDLVPEIPAALAQLETYEAEGTLWARTTAHGDDKDRPLVRSSDGSHLYFAADAAYMRHKLERFDRALYVLGADHHGYMGRLRALASMMGYGEDRVEILLYQLVHLMKGGEQAKMSKRRGDVVFLDEFMDEIGVDAARWYLVNRGPDQAIEIDVDLASEASQKNPVYYVQYAHARIASILRSAEETPAAAPSGEAGLMSPERELIKRLADFPQVAQEAAERRAPQRIPTYAIEVADDFHRFYHDCKVIGSDNEAFRLELCRAAQGVIARCLDLVGVDAPERM